MNTKATTDSIRHYFFLKIILCTIALLAGGGVVWGMDYTWTGGGDGTTWTDVNNWSPNTGYPGQAANDSATINSGSAVTLNVTPANALASLALSGASDSLALGSNNLNAGTLSGSGTITVAGGTLTANGTIGSITMTSGSLTLSDNLTVSGLAQLLSVSGAYNLALQGSSADTLSSVNLGTGTLDLTGMTGGSVTVSGALTAANLTTASAAYNIALTGGATISNDVTLSNTGTLTLGASGMTTTFTGGVTATAPSIVSVGGTISTGGVAGQDITLGDGDTPVVLIADTVLSAGAGNITLGGTVNADAAANNRTITLNSTGTTILGGAVGGTQSLGTLTTDAGGTTQINGGGVTTSGAQSYGDAVTLGSNTTLTTTNNNVTFAGTVNGAQSLTASVGTGLVSFGGAVGGGTALTSISVTSTNGGYNAITLRNMTTTGAQTYTGNVTLGATTALTTTSNGSISITGTVSGAQDLTISTNGTGTVSFGGDVTVGATAAGALSISAASLSLASGVDISTAGVNGNISLTVDGFSLGGTNTINAGTGTFAIAPRTSTYTVEFSPTDTALVTDVYYNSAFTGITAGTFRVGSAAHTGTIYVATAAMTPSYSLTVQNNGSIVVAGSYDSSAGNGNLTLDSGAGGIVLNGGTVNLGNGTFTAQDAVTLGANTTITANGGIAFQGTIDADNADNNRTLTLNCSGAVTLSGAVGATQALQTLTSDAGGTLSLPAVTTRGAQTYNDGTVTLNGTLTVNTAGAGVTIPNSVALGAGGGTITLTGSDPNNDITLGAVSGAQALNLTAGGGDVTIGSTNGTPTGLTSTSSTFTTAGSVIVASGGSISITADQIALGNTLGNSGAGSITLQPTSDAVTIGLNDPAGTFNLTATELGYLTTTGTVTIGRATGTGAITIGGSGATNISGTTYNFTIEGATSPVSFAASTLTLGTGKTLTFSNGGNITVTSGATHVAIAGAGTVAFPQAGSVGASGNPLVVSVANLGASTLTGGLYLQAQTNLTVSGIITTNNNPVEIDTGANTFSSGFNINAGTSTFTLTASDVNLTGGVITANGGIVFQPNTDGAAIYLNNAGAGFSLSAAELTTRIDSSSTVTIGRATGTGTITIGGSGSINAGAESYSFTLRGASSNVVFNFAGGNTFTLPNNQTFTINTGGAVTSPGATTADITIGGTGSLSILSATTVGTSADPLRIAVANITGISSNGDLYIQDADGFTITGAVTNLAASPVLSFNGGTGTITTSGAGTITAGSGGGGSLILTADDMVIGTTLTANGGILIVPSTPTRGIGLNDPTAGTLSLSATELQYLSCSGTVTIGRSADGSGTIYIGGSGAINLGATAYNLTIEGATSPVSFAASTLTLGTGKTLTFSNGGNITVTSGATHVAIAGAGTVAFPQAGSVGASGNPLVVSVANLGASTLTGGLYLQDQTNLTVSGAVSAIGVEIDTGANSLTVSNTIASGAGNLTLTADTLALGAALSGTGALILQPASAGRLVSIGTSGAQFDVDDTELAFLQNGFSSITIGRNTSGAVTVDTAAFVDPVTILSGSTVTLNAGSPTLSTTQDNAGIAVTANGTITVNGVVSAHGTGTVSLTAIGGASNIALAADIQSVSNGTLTLTAGQNITWSAGTLGAAGSSSLLVLSAGGSIGASGAAVATDVGTIRASASGNIYLSEANAVQLGDGGGGVTTSGGLIDIVTGGAITFGNTVTTTGTGTSISLNATSGGIAISQNVAAANNATITLTAGGGGSITRTAGTVGAGGSSSLLVLSSGASIGASGAVLLTDMGTIRATAAGDIYLSEASGVQLGDASGPITTSNGVINITASGNITTGVWGGGDILSTTGGTGSITVTTTAGGTITLSDSVASTEGGLVTLTNAGVLTISAPITARGGFAQNGAGAVSMGANIITTGDAISFQRAVTLTSGVSLDSTNGDANPAGGNVTFQSTLSGAQNLTVNGGTGGTATFTGAVGATPLTALTVSGALSTVFSSSVAVNGPVNITADEINFTGGAGSFSGNSTLVLQPYTASQAIAIGGAADTGVGTLDLIASDIAALANGFTSVTIGSATGTGAITVSGAVSFLDPVTIRSPTGAGSMTVNGQITGSDNASITLDAGIGGISLGASIVTAGNSITLEDAVTVTANISLDTTNGGAVPAGAIITLNGTVNGAVADTQQLTLRCGQQTLTITQAIGVTNRFSVLTIRADDIALSAALRGQTINLYTGTPATRAMLIGANAGGLFALDDAELALLSGFSALVIGESSQQAATVTVRTATSPVPAASITVYADSGAGGIVLDDQSTSTALATGGTGNITLVAGTGGITSSSATNGVAELSTAGTITLTSAGAIGSAANRIQFPAGQANVAVTNAPGGVWFGGLGGLSLGAITTNSTGASGLDVTSSGLLTLIGAVSTSSGDIALNSSGNGITVNSTISGNSLTITNGGAVDLNNTVNVPNGFSSAGTSFDNTGATISTTNTAITINHTGAVTVGATLSAGNGTITVTSTGSSVSIGAALSGGSGAVSVTSSTSTVTLAAPITLSTGAVSIDSGGGTSVSAGGDITATGAAPVNFGQTLSGPIITAGNVTTSGGAVRFYRAVTLTGNITISTGAGAGDITLTSTVNPQAASTQGLTLVAGTGNINVTGPVGNLLRLGALSISSAANATITNNVTGSSFTQGSGSGTTTFNGNQDYTASFSFTGTDLVQNGTLNVGTTYTFSGTNSIQNDTVTTGGNYQFTGAALTVNEGMTVGGTTNITNSGLFTIGASGNIQPATVMVVTGATVNNGIITAGTGGTAFQGDFSGAGTLNGNIGATSEPTISFMGGNVTFGIFNHNSDIVRFAGSTTTNFDSNDNELLNVLVEKDDNTYGVVLATHSVTQRGAALDIKRGYIDIDTNYLGWIMDSVAGSPIADTFTGVNGTLTLQAGTELRCGNFDSQAGHIITNSGLNTITASGNVTIAGSFNTPTNSTIVMTGTSKTLTATPQIGNLHIGTGITGTASGPTATVTLGANLSMAGNMEINDEGSLDVAAYDITISGTYWLNRVSTWTPDDVAEPISINTARFEPQNRTVTIIPSGTEFRVYGNNRWYNLTCTKPGVTLKFEAYKIQRFLPGGTFTMQGTNTQKITLSRTTPFGVSEPSDYQTIDLSWNPIDSATLPYSIEPDATKMWQIDMLPPGTLNFNYVEVKYSDARLHALGVGDTVTLFDATTLTSGQTFPPFIKPTCFKWIDSILVVNSYTEDSDGNGKIDRIRVTSETALNYNFSDFDVIVEGYDINRSKGTNGFEQKTSGLAPYLGSEFYIWLVEKPYLDTDATPQWRIVKNTTLKDQSANKYVLKQIFPELFDTPTDTALPRLAYTLTLINGNDTFGHFSEPVYSTGGKLVYSSFTGSTNLTAITTVSDGTKEVLVTFGSARTISDIATLPVSLNLINIWDNATPPHDYSTDPSWTSLGRPLPPPYNAYGHEGQTNPGTNWANDWPNPIASDTFPIANDNTNPTASHRVSDVLISVPPASAADDRYFVWPIWARDSVITEVSESQYESLSGPEAASQTIGLVRDFTGTQWLRDQDITMQVRVNPALTPGNLSLHFDSNVADTFRATSANGPIGLWLPIFNQGSPFGAAFSGIVPWPNDPAHGGGTSLYAGTKQGTVLPSSALWNFSIPSSDPRVRSVSTLEFFFTLDTGANADDPLYVARLDVAPGAPIPPDWYRRVKPFSFDIHDVTKQRSNATILNNVIDPTKGERVRLSYQLTKPGQVTIQVFTLDGDLVQVLYRGYRQAGDYTASWDGKNRGGRVVARGMYFIRIVGPEIDEIRKVMVVKE